MIETHVLNALLRVALKEETSFKVLTFVNGLVAPAFLFCAGFAFMISLRRKWDDYRSFGPSFRQYVVRLLFILAVAYSLHIPFFSLKRMLALTDEHAWISFFQVDILQVISVTLLILVWTAAIVRKENVFLPLSGLACLGIVLAAPVVRQMDLVQLPVWLRSYFSMGMKSQFPVFPWSAFIIAGMLVGAWFGKSFERGTSSRFIRMSVLWSLLVIGLSVVVEYLPISIYTNHDFWKASPEFFLVRLGIIGLCMSALRYYEHRHQSRSRSLFTLFGQESLLVYVVHLLIVYGYTYEFSFVRLFGPTLSYLQCFALFAGLTIVMYGLALVWHWVKGWNKQVARAVQFTVIGVTVVMFMVK